MKSELKPDDGMLWSYSGVSAFTGRGFVTLRWGTETAMMTPAEAREFALGVIETADAAESDALMTAELKRLGIGENEAAAFLVRIRTRREEEANS